jgi:L-Lysine epsilon oxidase N-terminal/L-lysine epsilon oxidase C-terminal domain
MPIIKTHGTKPNSRAPRAKQSRKRASVVATLAGLNARLGARTEYRIYPSIGIARVGDCKDSFVLGPEAPRMVPSGPFRGLDGGIKPQAARFRIYKVDIDANENEVVTEEVIAGGDTEIEWSVSLANRKAAGFQIADTLARAPRPRLRNDGFDRKKLVISASGSVTGFATNGHLLSGAIEFARPRATGPKVTNIALATLRTDEKGRLVVVGGRGNSGSPLNSSINSFSDNNGWYDSVSDGPVSAVLHIHGQAQQVVSAWVVVTVPRYAPGIYGMVTWYDRAVSMARTGSDGIFNSPRTTSFTRDICPILQRADRLSAVHGVAHANGVIPPLSDAAQIAAFGDASERAKVLSKLAPIGTAAPGPQELPAGRMPQLYSGANPDPDGPAWTYMALTKYQMAHMQNWVRGNFDADWTGTAPTPVPFEQIPVARQAWALCEAALEACVGGPFYPGIEGTYDIARLETYHPESNLRREFRINPTHPAGVLTERMALPWQADFADCTNYWWPSQRPDDVTTKTGDKVRWDRDIAGPTRNQHLNMVHLWSKLGFVVFDELTGKFVEDERTFGTGFA